MRKLIALLFTSLMIFGVSNVSQANAAVDPPPAFMMEKYAAELAAPAAPVVPVSTVSTGSSTLTATRIWSAHELSVPNTACWHYQWSKRFSNAYNDTLAYPVFWADVCWRNYVVIGGTDWDCYNRPMEHFRDDGCDFGFGTTGAATRFASGGWDYSWGLGWFTINRDVNLEVTFSPGVMTGHWWENF